MKALKDVKIIASDLDNTLLLPNGDLPENFFTLIEELHNNGIYFAPASGRPYSTLHKMFEPVLDKVICIADNGGHIKYKDETIFVDEISREEIKTFVDFTLKNTDGIPILFTPNYCYTTLEGLKYKEIFGNFMANLKYVEDLYQVDEPFDKFTVYFPEKVSIEMCENLYKPEFGDDYYIVTGDDHFIDIQNKDCNKGTALRKIESFFEVPTDEMMAFGDHLNDKELIETAYFGYAVENAFEELKKSARFIADSNENLGVVKEIEKVLKDKQAS